MLICFTGGGTIHTVLVLPEVLVYTFIITLFSYQFHPHKNSLLERTKKPPSEASRRQAYKRPGLCQMLDYVPEMISMHFEYVIALGSKIS